MKLRNALPLGALLILLSLLTGCLFPFGGGLWDDDHGDYNNNYGNDGNVTEATANTAGTLYALQADEIYFVANTTYETRFTVRAEGVSQVSLTHEGETVCPMVDDGSDGDALAGDGIFTCTVTHSSDRTESDQLYAVSGSLTSEPVTLYFFAEPTEEALEVVTMAQLLFRQTLNNYSDGEGFVSPSDVPAVLEQAEAIVQPMYNRGEVLDYQVYDTHVRAKFSCGLTVIFAPPLAGVDSSGGNVSVHTFQPFRYSYNAFVEDYMDLPDEAARLLTQRFDNYSFTRNNDEEDVTLQTISSFGEDQVVLWHGHGDYDEALGPYLITGERYDRERMMEQAYFEDVVHDRIICSSGNRMAFTAAYVDERCGSMEGSFLYLGSCDSGKDSRLADAFLNKGAVAVVANTESIATIYNISMEYQTMYYMTQLNTSATDYCTLSEALARAMGDLGENDANFSYNAARDAHPVIFGGAAAENFRLGDLWSGVFPSPETEPPATEPTQPTAAPTEPSVTGTLYADYQWFLDSYTWVDYVASDLSEIPADQYADFWLGNYCIYDVNKDGVDELIILCGQSMSDTSFNFYTWRDGEICAMGAVFAGSDLYVRRDGMAGILAREARGDIETLTWLQLNRDGLTVLKEEEYYYQREDYVDPKTDWVWLEQYSVHDTSILTTLSG